MERIEDWKTEVSNLYLKCRRQKLKSEFFRSCVSEGLIPNGVKGKFNLAMDVNNQDFVQSIEEEMDFHSSRILDLLAPSVALVFIMVYYIYQFQF